MTFHLRLSSAPSCSSLIALDSNLDKLAGDLHLGIEPYERSHLTVSVYHFGTSFIDDQ